MTNTNKHPKGLYALFTVEMWERFNFYGMRTIFTLFLINCIGFNSNDAFKIYGAYGGLVYFATIIGGFIADNYWGNKKSLITGSILMSIGQLFMFASGSVFDTNLPLAKVFLFTALFFIVLGVGLFKPNISSLVGKLYPDNDKRLDAAYTVFYFGINLGAFLGMNICAYLGDVKTQDGIRNLHAFKWGFLAASIAMIIGAIAYSILNKKYIVSHDNKPLGLKPNKINNNEKTIVSTNKKMLLVGLSIVLCYIFYWLLASKQNDVIAFIYAFLYSVGISLVLYILLDTSLTQQEKRKVGVIIICSFFTIFFWAAFEQAASSLTYIADQQVDTTILGIVLPPSLVQNFNSLFIMIFAPLMSMIWLNLSKKNLEPNSYLKFGWGFILLALGYFIIALRVKNLSVDEKINVIWLVFLYAFHTLGELFVSPIGLSLVFQLAPRRLTSVLMGVWFLCSAAGYALGGTLGALLPPSPDHYKKALTLGIDLNNVLNNINIDANIINTLKINNLPFAYPQILGIPIENLYQFFMCFVIMIVAIGIVIFIVSKRLYKISQE